jgi:hypothetical protein
MPSTRKSSTKSGRAKAATSTKCAPTKSNATLTTSSSPEILPPATLDEAAKQIHAWILAGHSETDLNEALARFFPALDPKKLVEAAAEKLRQAGRGDRDLIRGFCIEAYRTIYQKAFHIGDYGTALKALARLELAASK